jgi:ATP-dependent protease HslVU (ClpYQ) peptidase subunit
MTCIAAIKELSQIIMVSDSGSIDTESMFILNRADQKMVIKDNRFLIGFAGSYRIGQIIVSNFMPPRNDSMNPEKYMRTDFIAAMRESLSENGIQSQTMDNTSFLIGYAGQLFWIQDDFQIAEIAHDYMAIGSGCEVALGSLFSTESLTSEERLTTALRASMEFKAGIRAPFHMLRLPISSSL